jgi:hypothetical protein
MAKNGLTKIALAARGTIFFSNGFLFSVVKGSNKNV